MDDKRKRTRVEFITHVILKIEGSENLIEGDSHDLSMNGLFIQTERRIPIGTPCDLKLILPGGSVEMFLNIKGEISRHTQEGMGIRFSSMNPDTFSHLKKIAMYNSSDPDTIEEEIFKLPFK
ncbi:Type IV pilus assembly PilZ [Candidatus Magnetomoraceae bacterium gMMP-15]